MSGRIAPTLLLLAAAGSASAASAAARDLHFQDALGLVERGLRPSAERLIDAFAKAGYPDGETWAKGLRFAYTGRFRTDGPADRLAAFATEYEALRRELTPRVASLPPPIKELVEGNATRELVTAAAAINGPRGPLNPYQPKATGEKLDGEQLERLKATVRRLIETADRALEPALKAVKAHDPELEKAEQLEDNNPKYREAQDKAVRLRFEYASALCRVVKTMREVDLRGRGVGLPPEVMSGIYDPWIHRILVQHGEMLSEWGWAFGDMNPWLRHRLAVIRSEAVRLSERTKLGRIKEISADDIRSAFQAVIDLNLKGVDPKTAQEARNLKLETWSDLLLWQAAMRNKKYLESSSKDWLEFQSRNANVQNADRVQLTDNRRDLRISLGYLYLTAARVAHQRGDAVARDKALIEVQRAAPTNELAGNARLWSTYFASQSGASSQNNLWAAQPEPMDPEIAITLGQTLRADARRSTQPERTKAFLLRAAVQLRNGILALNDANLVKNGPDLYNLYARTLNDLEMPYHAVAAAEAGLLRMRPLWTRPTNQGGNPWMDKKGALTPSGLMVRNLSNMFVSYSSRLASGRSSGGSQAAYQRSLDLLAIFDPESVSGNMVWVDIIFDIGNGRYDDAVAKLQAHEAKVGAKAEASERLKIIETRAKIFNAQWGDLPEAAPKADKDRLDQQLEKALAELKAYLEPLQQPNATLPAGLTREQVATAWRMAKALDAGRLIKTGRYDEVLAQLGDVANWNPPPKDPELARSMLRDMCNAAYLHFKKASQTKYAGLAELVADLRKNWPGYLAAAKAFDATLAAHPQLAEQILNQRRQLSAIFPNVDRIIELNLDKLPDGADKAALGQMGHEAKSLFATLYTPLIDETTKPNTVLAVALALWDLEQHAKAVLLFERYKKGLAQDPDLEAFARDPKGLVSEFARKLNARTALAKYWQRNGKESLVDLLVDEPGFAKEYVDPSKRPDTLSEHKRDFQRAAVVVRQFLADFDKDKTVIGGYDELRKDAVRFQNLVDSLATQVSIDGRLVDGYMRLGRANDSVALAKALYEYDPLDPTYMGVSIEGALQAVKAGTASKDQTIWARDLAVRLREMTSGSAKHRHEYWTSCIQVMELSLALGDKETASNTLNRNLLDKYHPVPDMTFPPEQGSEDRVVRDAGSLDLLRRYFAIFETVGRVAPYILATNEQGREVVRPASTGAAP